MELVLRWVGIVVLFLIAFVLLFSLIVAVDRMITYPTLFSGVVTNKCYYDGHPYSSSWTFGSFSFTKRYKPDPYYYIVVMKGEKQDFWKVTEEEWDQITIGQTISRSFFSSTD